MWRRLAVWLGRLAYLGILGALLVFTAYSSFSQFVRRGGTQVPGLIGLELEEAERLVMDHGLSLVHREEGDRFAEDVLPGRVLEQQPAAGSLAKRGGRIEVVLSRGKRLVEVPDLTGKALPAAQVTLAAVGLDIGDVAYIFSGGGSVGTVVSQQPLSGELVNRGAPVALFLVAESLAATYVMPDLVNREYSAVRHFLERRGFRIGTVKYEPYEGIFESLVLRQFPLPGHPLRQTDVISLVVAAVPEQEGV